MRVYIWSGIAIVFVAAVALILSYGDPLQFYKQAVEEGVQKVQSEFNRAQELEAARERARIRSRDYDAAYEAGLELQEQKRFEDAIAKYDEAIAIWKIKHEAHCRQAECLNALKRYEETVEVGDRYITYANCPNLLCCVASAHEQMGNYAEAIAGYQRAIQESDDWIRAHNNLAWLYAGCLDEAFVDGPKALFHAQKAYALWQQNPECTPEWIAKSLLGAAYSRNNDFQQAISYTEQALPIAPQSEQERLRRVIDDYREGIPYHREPENSDELEPATAEIE